MAERPAAQGDVPLRDGVIRWFDLFIAFFGGMFAGIVLGVIGALPAILIGLHWSGGPLDPQTLADFARTDFAVNQVLLVGSNLGLLGLVWLVAHWRFDKPITHYFAVVRWPSLGLAIVAGAGLSLLLNGGNAMLERLSWVRFEDSDVERAMVPHGPAQLLAAIAVIGVLAPFVEEFFFRGLLFSWARRQWGTWIAVLATGAIFALVHGHFLLHVGAQAWIYTIELFVAGVVLALLVARTGSLRTSFAMHAAYNVTAIAFSVLLP
ncbi:MAG: CPBP family intramembrane glutamic endopeptidase [Rhizomicrobium sp.]